MLRTTLSMHFQETKDTLVLPLDQAPVCSERSNISLCSERFQHIHKCVQIDILVLLHTSIFSSRINNYIQPD